MKKYYELANGIKIPTIGFGTWQIADGDDAYNSTLYALNCGYRLIDTAYAYGNEKSIGKAIKDSKIDRKDIFITTKLPAQIKGYDECINYFNMSLKNLDTNYIDLYLIHAPWPWTNVGDDYTKENIKTWKDMIDLYKQGKVKSIGVSNFSINDIKALIDATNFKPMVNQIRFFIGNTQKPLYDYCIENNILIEAYSPLATGKLLENQVLIEMANKYNTTIAKICLAYCLDKKTLPLPKSTHNQRIKDNLIIDITLEDDDIKLLDTLHDKSLDRPLRS